MRNKRLESLALGFLLLVVTTGAAAQSRDRDHPKPMRSNELKGDLDGSAEESFYSFVAGPGEVKIAVDVESSDGTADLEFELLDKDAANKIICCEFAQADSTGESGRTVKSAKFARSQTVVLHLTKAGAEGMFTADNPIWVDFARGMAPLMTLPAELIAELVGAESGQRWKVLDIAAGSGLYGIAIAKRNPNAEIIAVDSPSVLEVARENAEAAGVIGRYDTMRLR